nr:PREDICTED: uncharacterized protein LOC109034658 [Bemisia tabaci]
MRLHIKVFVLLCLICLASASGSESPKSKGKYRIKLPPWMKNMAEMRWPWKKRPKDNREFVKGRGQDLEMTAGDTIVSAMIPNRRILCVPYRWMYAIDHAHVIAFWPGLGTLTNVAKKGKTNAHLVNIKSEMTGDKLMNRGRKRKHIGIVGSLVAALMIESKHDLPFHAFRCAGKHYVEYLSRGKAQGSPLSYMHNKMMAECPLRAPLTKDMARTIFHSGKFTLHGKGDKHVIHLALPGVEKLSEGHSARDLWPQYIRDMKLFQ